MAEQSAFDYATEQVENQKLIQRDAPIVVRSETVGTRTWKDIPLQQIDFSKVTKVKQFFEILSVVNSPLDFEDIGRNITLQRLDELPEPVRPKEKVDIHYKLNMAVGKESDQMQTVVKWVVFDDKVNLINVQKLVRGTAYQIKYGKNYRTGTKAVLYLFQQLGGWQILWMGLTVANVKIQRSASQLMTGFDYIKANGPRDSMANKFVIWTEIEINSEESPIFGWDRGLVMQSLKNHLADAGLAKPVSDYPLALHDIAGWFLDDVLADLVPYLQENRGRHGIVDLGAVDRVVRAVGS